MILKLNLNKQQTVIKVNVMNIEKITLVNEAIANFLENNAGCEVYTSICSCGAVTMSACNSSDEISFLQENAPFIKATNDALMCNCNHCCNSWGVDVEEEEEDNE
ncbi:MAG: hypothetical protein GY861_02395 [bacterium]|nr:hypothetical protein [bacterium]